MKKKNEYISIIIPCYNVEKYVEDTLNSILNQTYKNYEIIFVDDVSSDNTYKIIKNYEKKYKFVRALQNPVNSGAGAARNLGLKEAKYDIISFIDSDDTIEDNFYEVMINKMIDEKSDLVACDIYMRYDKEFDITSSDVRSVACCGQIDKENLINNGLAASPCNKLIKKELLINNPFPTNMMNEDVPTIIGAIIDAEKVSYTTKTYYNYFQRKTSVQNNSLSFKKFDVFKALDILTERKKDAENYDEFLKILIYNQIVLFFVYVIPREKRFFFRWKFLRRFSKLSRNMKIRSNHYYWNFIETQPKMSKRYYKLIFKLNDLGMALFVNLLISVYRLYRIRRSKGVIKTDISINDLIGAAKQQKRLRKEKINISVVVPNYNYEKFLYQRLYSILYQSKKINELIILDDCSTDNSRQLIDEIVEKLKPYINIRKEYNKTNSGTAFKQWQKGFEIAKGDYVWIAEADDYCSNTFLKNVLKPIENDHDIVISYTDTSFINVFGYRTIKTIKPEIDIMKTGHWDSNFVNDGLQEIKDYSFLNCTIANVSSVIFKRADYSKFFEISGTYRQAGDWLFYVNVMSTGKIAFINKPLNYYRVHGNNVTTLTKKKQHFDEIMRVHKFVKEKFGINKDQQKEIEERYKFLRKAWDLDEKK